MQQVLCARQRRRAFQIGRCGEGAHGHVGNLAGNELGLGRGCHANGDIGIACQQVLDLVGCDDLHLKAGFGVPQGGDDLRQKEMGNDLAGRDAHGSRDILRGTGRRQRQCSRVRGDAPCMVQKRRSRPCQRHAARQALEQGDAKARFQLRHVAAKGGLAGFQTPCRA